MLILGRVLLGLGVGFTNQVSQWIWIMLVQLIYYISLIFNSRVFFSKSIHNGATHFLVFNRVTQIIYNFLVYTSLIYNFVIIVPNKHSILPSSNSTLLKKSFKWVPQITHLTNNSTSL
jgi:hypothetical protein